MFEVKYLVKNDIDNLDRVFDTEKEMNEWIKSMEIELLEEKFKSMLIAELDIPLVDHCCETGVYIIKLNNHEDYEVIEKWYKRYSTWGDNYLEEPENYPCTKMLITTENYIEFAVFDLDTLIHKFSVVTSVLANINRKEHNK